MKFVSINFAALLALILTAGDSRALNGEPYTWHPVPTNADQAALFKGNEQVGNYLFSRQAYYVYDRTKEVFEEKPVPCPVLPPLQLASESNDALAEVNAVRTVRGLRPYILDAGLTQAALGAARFRAANRFAGHTANDFAFLPSGTSATAAGCAAWEDSWGWGSCCTYDGYTYAGAAWVRGSDNRRYMHLFVR